MVLALLALLMHTTVPPIGHDSSVPASGGSARSGDDSTRRLRVRVSVESIPPRQPFRVTSLAEEVRDIWNPYAEVDLVDARDADTKLYDEHLRLAIVDHAQDGPDGTSMALGWIGFYGPNRPANLITVSTATVATILQEARWRSIRLKDWPPRIRETFFQRALGRTIAHEIGHFLLRSRAHAPSGLMRESIPVPEIMERRRSHLSLRPEEVALLNRATALLAAAPAVSEGNVQ
jgi:hypothetical protein